MKSHPGGEAHTRRMLALAELPSRARILDLGAGAGESLALLKSLGYEAEGIDLEPRGENVRQGDLLHTGYAEGSMDAVLSQCSFFVSGDVSGALREAHRVLKQGGLLLWSDVFFVPHRPLLDAAGFSILREEDMTPAWKDYYIEALWRGTVDCCVPRGKCSYWLLIGKKG